MRYSSLFLLEILFFTGQGVLSKTVYGQAFTEQMENQQFSKLQDYVKKESISLENLQRINAWCSRGEKVYLTIYNNGTLVFESNNLDIDYDESELLEYNPDYEDPEREYELILQGDIKVRAFPYYYVGDAYYFLVTIISGLCAFCLFTFCFMTIINRKITYIRLLKKELDILSSGQLEYPITISGKDELSDKDYEYLRESFYAEEGFKNTVEVIKSLNLEERAEGDYS